jgi:heme A synthase
MFSAGLHRYTVFFALCTFALVLAGASIVSRDGRAATAASRAGSGLTDLHQVLGAACGIVAVILMTWLQRTNEPNWLKLLTLLTLALIGLQGAAGMIGLTGMAPGLVAIPHAVMAHVCFALAALVAVFTSRSWKERRERIPDGGFPSLRSMAVLTPAVVVLQIGLGAAYRHQAIGLVPHVSWAFAAAIVAMMGATFVLVQEQKHSAMRTAAIWLLVLTLLQILAGVAAYFTRAALADNPGLMNWMMASTVAHVGIGSLVLAASAILGAYILRNVVTASSNSPAAGQQLAGSGRSR